jgi:hypothetical protein
MLILFAKRWIEAVSYIWGGGVLNGLHPNTKRFKNFKNYFKRMLYFNGAYLKFASNVKSFWDIL